MGKKLFVILLSLSFVLSACSMKVSKGDEDETKNVDVTEDLSKDSKVREIELYVTTPDYDPIRYEFGLMIAEEWRKLGFDVKVTPLAWNRLAELGIVQKKFDAFTLAWGGRAERIDPDFFVYQTLHSSQQGVGEYNITGYSNPEYDKVAEAQRRATNKKERQKLVYKAQEIFLEDLPYAPIAHRNQLMAYNKKNFTNMTYMMGEGLNSFWTFMNATPTGNRKVLRWGYPSDIATLNPLSATNTHDFQVMRLIYDRLVRIGPDGQPKLWAAKSIKDVNGDGKTFDITLRSGMKFHDGKPVTAEDVKFSFDLVKKVKAPHFIGIVEPIKSVEVIDDLTVRFHLKYAYAPFKANILGRMFILPKHYWKPILENKGAEGVLQNQNEKIIGSGPFKLEYWRKNQEMKLVRNDQYFKKPKLGGILCIPYSNTQSLFAAVNEGKADLLGWWIQPTEIDELKKNPNIKVVSVPDHGFYHINYNLRRMPFNDKAVRLAMSYVIPKKRIVEELLLGYGTVANSMIAKVNEFWHNPNIEGFSYNPKKARKILKEAGYRWDEKGKIHYPEGVSDKGKENGIIRKVK